jgi:hypothetical protein
MLPFNKKKLFNSALFIFLSQPFSALYCADDFPALHRNLASSENYELVKVIDGSINGIFFNEQTQQIIVDSNNMLWKIDQQGIVIGKMVKQQHFFASGYAFDLKGYNDWIYSGELYNKKYQNSIDARNYNLTKLFALFDSAEVVEFSRERDKDYAHLYNKSGAILVDITGRRDLIHKRCEIHERRFTDMNWKDVCFENYKRNNNLVIIDKSLVGYRSSFESDNEEGPLRPIKFKRRQYHIEEGLLGQVVSYVLFPLLKGLKGEMPSRYWYGDTHFELKHHDEILKFKAFTNKKNDRINHRNLSIFEMPISSPDSIKLLKISYFDNQYLESGTELNELYSKDVGLYLVRKKGVNPAVIHNIRKAKWKVRYSGMPSAKRMFGYISFTGTSFSEKQFMLDRNTMSPVYDLPDIIAFEWFSQDKKSAFELQVSDSKIVTFQEENKDTQVGISVEFDQTELTDAFKQLSDQSKEKNKDTIINIIIQFNQLNENKAQLKIILESNSQQIELKQNSYGFRNVKEKSQSFTYVNQLKVLYEESINKGSLDAVLLHIDTLAIQPDYIDKKLEYAVYVLTLLLNHYNVHRGFEQSKQIGLYYANNIRHLVPQLSDDSTANINHYVLISQSLVASVQLNDLPYQKKVLAMLGENFDISILENPSLIYNLACYYALNKKKEKMLAAIRQSRKMGKPVTQFLADSDFSDYYRDSDFLKALNNDYN